MYTIKLRNYAVSMDGDLQEFLRDDLETAIRDTLITVSAGPNRVGTISPVEPGLVSPALFAFYSGDGRSITGTDYRHTDCERRFCRVSLEDIDAESRRLAGGVA
jgi:hypothetical protein